MGLRPSVRAVLVVVVLTLVAPAARAQPDEKAAADPVLRQLDAFRRNDFDTAYTFASAEIQRLFDRPAFERMVKSGYPEIADSVRAHVASTRIAPDGHLYLLVKIRGANGQHVEALYDMVREAGVWKINGVVAKPDPGEEA
jgi:hypothetical protein